MTVQDWGVTYDELEPYLRQVRVSLRHLPARPAICAARSRKAATRSKALARASSRTRRSRWPTGRPCSARRHASTGHTPFPCPAANMSRAYTNPLGVMLAPCTYCGFCEKFGCGNYSKSSPQTTILPVLMRRDNFELRTESEVIRINMDSTGKRATGVTYVDTQGNEFEQPAEMVFLCAYILHNVHLLLLSGIGQPYDPRTGQGVVGRNYAYQIVSSVDVFLDDKILNPFVGAGALGVGIDDYNGDNFDHTGLGFIGGGYLACWNTNGRPIEYHPVPKDTPKWGSKCKKAVAQNYLTTAAISTHGAVMSQSRQLPRSRSDVP